MFISEQVLNTVGSAAKAGSKKNKPKTISNSG